MSAGKGFAVLGLAVLAVVGGCSRPGSFAHVSGVVTHNGNPVEEAKITFVSMTESKGSKDEYSTTTDSSGKYLIAGVGSQPGLPPGRYKVVITRLKLKPGASVPDDFDLTQIEMSGLGVNTLPKEYGSVESTKLSATLDTGKNENVNFDLKGK